MSQGDLFTAPEHKPGWIHKTCGQATLTDRDGELYCTTCLLAIHPAYVSTVVVKA